MIENEILELPIFIEEHLLIYPFMITPLFLNDKDSLKTLEHAIKNESMIMVVSSKDESFSKDKFSKIYKNGVIGNIMRRVDLPDGRVKILFQGAYKGTILEPISQSPFLAKVKPIKLKDSDPEKLEALLSVLTSKVKTLSTLTSSFPPDLLKTIEESSSPERVIDLILSALRLTKDRYQEFFIQENLEKKYFDLIDYINKEIESFKLEKEIKSKVHSKIDKNNKEYFLKEQLKEIQRELGTENDKEEEIAEYRKKLNLKKPHMSEEAFKEIDKQIKRYSRLPSLQNSLHVLSKSRSCAQS